jgi:hypothetical protein
VTKPASPFGYLLHQGRDLLGDLLQSGVGSDLTAHDGVDHFALLAPDPRTGLSPG